MPWRIHLANRPLHRVDLLTNARSCLLAAWSQPDRVSYFDAETGAKLGDYHLTLDWLSLRSFDSWQAALEDFAAPNSAYPPMLVSDGGIIYLNHSGARRLYVGSDGSLLLANGTQETALTQDTVHVIAMDRVSGLLALLDSEARLHLYQDGQEARQIPLDMQIIPNRRTGLVVAEGGDAVYVAHDHRLLHVNTTTETVETLDVHYHIGQFASSPDGAFVACADTDTNVVRIYNGQGLSPLFQGHAVDLMVKAPQLQLIADLPPARVAVSNMALDHQGRLAFALAGVVCMTNLESLQAVPKIHQFA